MLTARQEERLLDVNPQEALPRGVHTPRRPPPQVAIATPEGTEYLRDREIFRMRTRPELYDEWMRDLIEDARAQVAEASGQFDWDCHVCQSSVLTYGEWDACPRCGAQARNTLAVQQMTNTQRAEMLTRVDKIGANL